MAAPSCLLPGLVALSILGCAPATRGDADLPTREELNERAAELRKEAQADQPSFDVREESAKERHFERCAEDEEMRNYCACTWKELRGRLRLRELEDGDETSERYQRARYEASHACVDELPESTVKAKFMKVCLRRPALRAYCECGYNHLTDRVSRRELVFGGDELRRMLPDIEQSCGALATPVEPHGGL
ncbi:MAG: hypothetical protein AAGA56_25940 [Myxococcota bacterium]